MTWRHNYVMLYTSLRTDNWRINYITWPIEYFRWLIFFILPDLLVLVAYWRRNCFNVSVKKKLQPLPCLPRARSVFTTKVENGVAGNFFFTSVTILGIQIIWNERLFQIEVSFVKKRSKTSVFNVKAVCSLAREGPMQNGPAVRNFCRISSELMSNSNRHLPEWLLLQLSAVLPCNEAYGSFSIVLTHKPRLHAA